MIVRDAANPGRRSLTKLAAAGQGGTVALAVLVAWANQRYDLGLDAESIAAVAALIYGALQAVSTWAQRRATEKVEMKLRNRPSGRELLT